jgi:exosome complex RNA-binding protein Rrp42 (RNase PH superfamily)
MMKSIGMLLTAVITLVSCSKESIRGSGRTLTETRSVTPFTGVRQEGSANVNITYGTQQTVE